MPVRKSVKILIPLLYAAAVAIAVFALFSTHQASASIICDEFGCITVDDGKTGTIRVDSEEQKFQAREALQAQQQEKLQKNQPQPLTPVVSCDLTELPCGILKALNWILDAVAYLPFSIAETFFGSMVNINFYAFNTADNPYMAGVQVGWKITSGVANMFFILILLWVAIATIFDFDPYTARSLLPRLIIMALLINFSLPIGRAFISLSNGIASVFLNAIHTNLGSVTPDGQRVSGFSGGIAKIFNPEAIITTINNEYLQMSKEEAAKILQEAKVTVANPFTLGLTVINWDAKECDDYVRGFFLPGTAAASWIGSFVLRSTYQECLTFLSSLRGAHATALAAYDPDHAKLAVLSMSLVGKAVALPVAIFVLFAGGIFLLVRLIALIIVLILGPIVFLLHILPATQQAWSRWWEALIKWSFFFPAFLFFLFISLFIYNGIGKATLITLKASQAGVPSYGALLVNYFIAAALMVGSLIIAQHMGVTFASAVTGWGKKMGKGVGKWTANRGWKYAGKATGAAMGTRVGAAAARIPVLGAGVRAGATAVIKKGAGVEKKDIEFYTKLSNRELARQFGSRAIPPHLRQAIYRSFNNTRKREFATEARRQNINLQDLVGTATWRQQRFPRIFGQPPPVTAPPLPLAQPPTQAQLQQIQNQAIQTQVMQNLQGLLSQLPPQLQAAASQGIQAGIQNLPLGAQPPAAAQAVNQAIQTTIQVQAPVNQVLMQSTLQNRNAQAQILNAVAHAVQAAQQAVQQAERQARAAPPPAQTAEELREEIEGVRSELEEEREERRRGGGGGAGA